MSRALTPGGRYFAGLTRQDALTLFELVARVERRARGALRAGVKPERR